MAYIRFAGNGKSATCTCMTSYLYFALGSWSAGCSARLLKNAQSLVFITVWIIFLEDFGQIKEWLILELYEMIKVSHLFACPIVFIFLANLVGIWECSNFNHFYVIFTIWVLSPTFSWHFKGGLNYNLPILLIL